MMKLLIFNCFSLLFDNFSLANHKQKPYILGIIICTNTILGLFLGGGLVGYFGWVVVDEEIKSLVNT